MGNTVLMRTPEGTTQEVPEDQVKFATDRGFTPLADEASTAYADQNKGDALTAGVTSALSGATLGGSDVVLRGFLDKGDLDYVRQSRASNQGLSTVANIAGAVAPAFLTGGASTEVTAGELGAEGAGAFDSLGALARATPSGIVSRQAAALAAEGEGASFAAKLGADAVGGAYEGAAQMAGNYISDVALGNRDLSAEGFASSVSTGALLGGSMGAGMGAIGAVGGKAMTSVRKLFPAHEMTREATEAAEGAFRDQLDQVVKDADEIEKTARQRMEEIRLDKMTNDASTSKRMGELRIEQAEQRVAAQKELLATRAARRQAAEARLGGGPALDAPADVGPEAADLEPGAAPEAAPTTAAEPAPTPAPGKPDAAPSEHGVADDERAADHEVMSATESKINQQLDDHIAAGDPEFRQLRDTVENLAARKKAVNEWVEKLKKPAAVGDLSHPRERYFAGFVDDAGHALDSGYEDALDRAAYAGSKAEKTTATQEAADLEKQIFGKVAAAGGNQAERLKGTLAARDAAKEDFLTIAQKRVAKREGKITDSVDAAMKTSRSTRIMGADVGVPHLDAEYDSALDAAMKAGSAPERVVAMKNAAAIEDRVLQAAQDAGGPAGERAKEILRLRQKSGYTGIKAARDRMATIDESTQRKLDYGVSAMQNRTAIDRLALRDAAASAARGVEAEPAALMARAEPSNVEDIAEAVRVVGGFEGAVHDAMQVAKPTAPVPGAEVSAKGYAEALARKEAATTTHATQAAEATQAAMGNPAARTAADVAHGAAPLDRAMALADQLEEHAATAKAARTVKEGAQQVRKEAGAAAKGSSKAAGKAADAPQSLLERAGGMGKKAKDIATVIETLHMLGVPGVPDPASIPVIGPVLGMYLKARAAVTVFRRLGGKVPATADTAIASAAATARTKALAAVQRAIDVGSAVASAGRTAAIPSASKILSQKLLGDGEDVTAAGKSPIERRVAELAAWKANRDDYVDRITRNLTTQDPSVAQAVAAVIDRKMGFLDGKAPKDPRPPTLVKGVWSVPPGQVEAFARYVRAVNDPQTVFDDLARGRCTSEGAEALRVVYPNMYAEAQQALLTKAPEMIASMSYQARANLRGLFRVPLDQTQTPEYVAWISKPSGAGSASATSQPGTQPAPGTPPQPGIAADVSLSQSTMTSFDRRAQR